MKIDTIRAWKDETYRQSLNEEQLRVLPANPAGELELTDADLQFISGSEGNSFSSFGSYFFNREENGFFNSGAFLCQNSIFSNTNTRDTSQSVINVSNVCTNVG